MTRTRLRKLLNDAGIDTGNRYDGAVATLVDYCDWWGIAPGAWAVAGEPAIRAALEAAEIPYFISGHYPMVRKVDTETAAVQCCDVAVPWPTDYTPVTCRSCGTRFEIKEAPAA